MRSASTSLMRTGLLFLCAAVLPGIAKSAPAAATTTFDEATQTEETTQADPPADETAPSTEPPASSEAPQTTAADSGPAGAAATDGEASEDEWILDPEEGRRYKIGKIPKIRGTFIWQDENHIRLPGGLSRMEVVKYDDRSFWIKIWEQHQLPDRRRPVHSKPTQEELDRAAESYAPEAGAVDRIQLEPFDRGLPQSGQWRQGFDVADMNDDGHLDIVFGPSRKGRPLPNIFLGDSRGNWRRWNEARYPRQPYDYGDAAVADFNGDGHQDVAFGFHLRGMLALIGDGEGGFEPWTDGLELKNLGAGSEATSFSSRAIEAIDWNRDGRPDLLALGEGPKGIRFSPGGADGTMSNTARSFALFVNQGDGSWSRQAVEEDSGDFGDDFALGDFDRDGRLDIIIASRRRGNREVLRTSAAGENGLLARQQLAPLRTRSALTSVAAADLDGDGFEELLLAYINRELDVWRTGIDLYKRAPDGEWHRRAVTSEESRAGFWGMTVGEIDNDGAPDLVAVTGEGQTWVFLGDRQGSFVREVSPELPRRVKGCEGSEVRLVDLDGDGRDEVLASFAGEPSGPAGLPGVISFPGCPGQGRIYAWRATSTAEDSDAAGGSPAGR